LRTSLSFEEERASNGVRSCVLSLDGEVIGRALFRPWGPDKGWWVADAQLRYRLHPRGAHFMAVEIESFIICADQILADS